MDDWSIRLRRAVAQQMASLEASGIQQLSRVAASAGDADTTEPTQSLPPSAAPSPTVAVQSDAARVDKLDALRQEVAACTRCEALACSRTQTVFGVGTPTPELCFLGEAPGYNEDQQGEPFVGAAGELLNDIIEKGMGLRRADVYILNVLKCRPPENRNPNSEEVENCRPFYLQQLQLLRPKFICCLGAFAAQALLETDLPVGKLRGRTHRFSTAGMQSDVVVTYHPAFLLRKPEQKSKTWDDIKLLMRLMGLKRT